MDIDKCTPSLDKQVERLSLSDSLIVLIVAIACLAVSFAFTYGFFFEVNFYLSSFSSFTYIKKSAVLVAGIALVPVFFWFAVASIQKLLGVDNQKCVVQCIRLGLWGLTFYFCLVFVANQFIVSTLKLNGYSYCYWYTGPSFRAPDVWLKNENLCLQSGSLIRSDIEDFFEGYNQQGTEPTLAELERFITETKQVGEDAIKGL
ncbi:hypothetical protein [Shewanella sp. Scap07]|uniref:hypothetical protein n=1 Tax=Shewanella sp. Scap07 TaxID=2589987 RepID=UPI00211736E6|nr:hypothetical protein [Shewanella sp. Scap07]